MVLRGEGRGFLVGLLDGLAWNGRCGVLVKCGWLGEYKMVECCRCTTRREKHTSSTLVVLMS